jgi:hypothetical protein
MAVDAKAVVAKREAAMARVYLVMVFSGFWIVDSGAAAVIRGGLTLLKQPPCQLT